MGKRKVQKTQPAATGAEESKPGRGIAEGKKTYNIQHTKQTNQGSGDIADLPKVQLPPKLEDALIDLIASEQKTRGQISDVSKRITTKKLTDVYNSLSLAGFTRPQVESAMSNTIMCGGDLMNALDWLCLNIQNDQLPSGFSETLHKEEERLRPKFDRSLQVDPLQATQEKGYSHMSTSDSFTKDAAGTSSSASKKTPSEAAKPGMKDWILQYAQQDSSDEEGSDEDVPEESFDPTARYVDLHSQLQELKDQAAIAKSNGATEQHKKLSKQLKELHLEMSSLEKQPEFDKSVKASLRAGDNPGKVKKSQAASNNTGDGAVSGASNVEEEEEEFGFGLFAAAEREMPSSSKPAPEKTKEEVRNFEYTRAQWTGKSPKQFLIDWVRKHLPGRPPPKFKKIQVKVDRFKSTCTVERQKDDILSVTPDILTQNVKDSEHLASTLALYHLCKGQPVHQLLPPPYRNVWLDWSDAEKKKKDDAKEKADKPRDQFISKLMKKLNLEDSTQVAKGKGSSLTSKAQSEAVENSDDDEDDWEALADKDQLSEIAPSTMASSSSLPQSPSSDTPGNSKLSSKLKDRHATTLHQRLLEDRKQLPVFQYKEEVLSVVRAHNVVVVAGETGSGKSTQIPQFVLEDCVGRGLGNVNIVVTEPRRISATSLAQRVAQELGEGADQGGLDIGNGGHRGEGHKNGGPLVGYQIRFESRRGPNTCLTYCTTGVVLRQLQGSANLTNVTHLIIDEVHERSVQSDFLMMVVKDILGRRPDLKVILMSATLDSDKFSAYFNHCPVINIPGRTFPVEVLYLEDAIEMTGYVVDEDSPYTLREHQLVKEDRAQVEVTGKAGNTSVQNLAWTQEDISKIDRTDLSSAKYSLRTRNAVTRLNQNRINFDLISDLLLHLDSSPPFCDIEGAVLIFLPGLADIQELYELLTTQRHFSDPKRYQIYALHSVLSSQDQGKVFSVPPPGVRKVVIATNIAETGITIPDVVYVIDSGKAKENRYVETSQMSSLEEVFVSKAAVKQRAGRAGRVRAGFCFRLFTQAQYGELRAFGTPELLRVPLEELCLNIMKCQFGPPQEFLQRALDPPSSLAVTRAISLLREVGACTADDVTSALTLTPLGHHLAALPVDVRIGKMLLMGAVLGCLEQVAIIAAAMTDKSPFVVPLSKKSEADTAKQSLALANSDHLTLLKAFHEWSKAKQDGKSAENTYVAKNYLKRSTLSDIENVSKDLVKLVRSIGFKPDLASTRLYSHEGHQPKPGEVLAISDVITLSGDELSPSNVALIKAVLTAGLYPQVGQVLTAPSVDVSELRSCQVETSQGLAQVHPSSVNKNLALPGTWLIYHEKVRRSKVYVRDTTLVSSYALLLFGGSIDVQHTQKLISLDGWIRFKAVARTGVIFKELRNLIDSVLSQKLRDPSLSLSGHPTIRLLREMIQTEKTR